MKKKLISLLLAAVMTTSLIACGNGTEKVASETTETPAKESTAASADVNEAPVEVDYYGFEEPVTVKIGVSYASASDFTFYGGETVEKNAWVDLYKANNIIPEILYEVDPSQADTKLSTAIMSGDYPDVFRIKGSEYQNMVESGAIADISEVFEKYASDELKEYMNYDGGMALGSLYVDGALYGLPKVTDPYSSAHMMWIRQDWLDNLGLKVPTTMDELKDVAYAFTYNDPDGDGQNNTYGLALDGINVLNDSVGNMAPIFEAFGVYLGKNGLTYVDNGSGNITWGGDNSEGMKEALQLLRDMYADGTIAKDFITMDNESIFAELGAGRAGIWFGPSWGAMNPSIDATKNDINCHMVAAEVPSGNGEVRKAYVSATPSQVYCVSSKCKNPELLIKLWNLSVKYQNAQYCTTDEYNMYYGDSANYSGWKTSIVEGGAPNGRTTNEHLTAAVKTGDPSTLNAKETENYTSIKTYMDAIEAGTFDPNDTAMQRGLSLYTVHMDPQSAWTVIWKKLKDNSYVESAYNGIPSDAVSSTTGTLQKLLTETIIKVITGADSVDSYDSFLQTWYAMGGQDAIDEANAGK